MEKVSAKLFFTVLWRGLCQALGWFFGLFGYKRDGKFAKCVWGLFAVSGTIVMMFIAGAVLYGLGDELNKTYFKSHRCSYSSCYYSEYVSEDVCFHNSRDGKGYIYNTAKGKKTIKNVEWIALPECDDSLVCYSDGKKRGYFNKNTGAMVIEPKYDHAWIFSEGLAGVDDAGTIKFIDSMGKTVIDTKAVFVPGNDGYVFHEGYCVLPTDEGKHYGLYDMAGKLVLPFEYDDISRISEYTMWQVTKGEEQGVFDKELNAVLPLMACNAVYIGNGTIDVTMPDHTMRKYDMKGNLIDDFYISGVCMLEYEKDEILRRQNTREEEEVFEEICYDEYYHPKATARLRAYIAGDGFEGLMTADGHLVTMPLYSDIDAIGPDLYLCTVSNGDKIIVNGKGENVLK